MQYLSLAKPLACLSFFSLPQVACCGGQQQSSLFLFVGTDGSGEHRVHTEGEARYNPIGHAGSDMLPRMHFYTSGNVLLRVWEIVWKCLMVNFICPRIKWVWDVIPSDTNNRNDHQAPTVKTTGTYTGHNLSANLFEYRLPAAKSDASTQFSRSALYRVYPFLLLRTLFLQTGRR